MPPEPDPMVDRPCHRAPRVVILRPTKRAACAVVAVKPMMNCVVTKGELTLNPSCLGAQRVTVRHYSAVLQMRHAACGSREGAQPQPPVQSPLLTNRGDTGRGRTRHEGDPARKTDLGLHAA